MLDEIFKNIFKTLLAGNRTIKNSEKPVRFLPNSEFLGDIGIFDKALTIYDRDEEGSNGKLPFLQLPNGKSCYFNGVKVIEVFSHYLNPNARTECFNSESNIPIENCSNMWTSRFFGPPFHPGEHKKWHLKKSRYHTHFVNSPDGMTLNDLEKNDIRCILERYRQSATVFKGLCNNQKSGIQCEVKELTANEFISEAEIQQIIHLYEKRDQFFTNFFNNLTQQTVMGFLEAFSVTFIFDLMQRYVIPKIRFQDNRSLSKELIATLNKVIPFLILFYRLSLGMSAFNHSIINLSFYFTFLAIDKVFSNQQMVINFNFIIGLFSMLKMNSEMINPEAFAKLFGFEIGKITAKNGIMLGEKLASQFIRYLPKLKEEDKSGDSTVQVVNRKGKESTLHKRR